MKIAIVGSREYPNLEDVRDFVRSLPPGFVIVSGGAKGVDRVAEDEAVKVGLKVEVFYPDWAKYGKRAGFLRNVGIVEAADELVAFWDGESKGTMHSVRLAKEKGIPVSICEKRK